MVVNLNSIRFLNAKVTKGFQGFHWKYHIAICILWFIECECSEGGSVDNTCDADGKCSCNNNIIGIKCNQCMEYYFNFPECSSRLHFQFLLTSATHFHVPGCDCSVEGSDSLQCGENGQCVCKTEFTGDKCDQCASTFFGYPDCKSCDCNEEGSKEKTCDAEGKCTCVENVTGDKCSSCTKGYYLFPQCEGNR